MNNIWHPFTQHGLNEPIIEIERTKDEFLFSKDGRKIIDGISSWWVNTHGHSNPKIMNAIRDQAQKMQQIIFAGFTHEPAIELSQKLNEFLPEKLKYTFFSDSGSTAVEVALKMAVGYFYNKGTQKSKIVAFEHAYHGDTFGGMSSGARGVFNCAYSKMLFDVVHLPFPEKNYEQKTIEAFEVLLKKEHDQIAAIIIEPLVLGSGGMLMYEPWVIDELYRLAKEYDVFFVLDEVMTGWGRTGTMFAFEQTNIVPDIVCLSKGLTGGAVPLAVTVASEEIYRAFYSGKKAEMFFHSSSYTANPIACAAGCANLEIWKNEDVLAKVNRINEFYLSKMEEFEGSRVLGSIFAFEAKTKGNDYLSDVGVKFYRFYRENDVLLRPLGNTIYVMPPYCTSYDSLNKIFAVIEESLGIN